LIFPPLVFPGLLLSFVYFLVGKLASPVSPPPSHPSSGDI
jgi:hypothetical protein